MNDIVGAVSKKMGVEIAYVQRPIDDAKEKWRGLGMNDDAIDQFAELCRLIDHHKCENISDDMEASIGREPTLFSTYLNSLLLDAPPSNKPDFFKNLLNPSKEIHYDSDDDDNNNNNNHPHPNNITPNPHPKHAHHDNISMIENNNPQHSNSAGDIKSHKAENNENANDPKEKLKNKPLWVPDSGTSACMKCGSTFHILKRRVSLSPLPPPPPLSSPNLTQHYGNHHDGDDAHGGSF
jgi:hypothetical protein